MKNSEQFLWLILPGFAQDPDRNLSGSFLTWHVCHRKNIGFAKNAFEFCSADISLLPSLLFFTKKPLVGYLSGNSRFFGWFLSIDHATTIESFICEVEPFNFRYRIDKCWNLELSTLYEIMMMFSALIQFMFNQKTVAFHWPLSNLSNSWMKEDFFSDCNSASWSSIIFLGKKIFKSIKPIYNHNNKRVYMSHFFLSLIS